MAVSVCDPMVNGRTPVLYLVLFSKLTPVAVTEPPLNFGFGDNVYLIKVNLQIIDTLVEYHRARAPRSSANFDVCSRMELEKGNRM